MSHQFPYECLSEIFEHLENDALRSCLLVNRFWCEVSVPILWTSIQNYNTLIACLPNESKETLYKNEIILSIPNLKPPSFNYVIFIKNLSSEVGYEIRNLFTLFLDYNQMTVVTQELFKMFMNQTSLKKIVCCDLNVIQKIPFTTYSRAIDCLKNLSELSCDSDTFSEFFYRLSQICYNIQSLNLDIKDCISNGLADLVYVQ